MGDLFALRLPADVVSGSDPMATAWYDSKSTGGPGK
jgi:hypothetical protein